MNTTQFKELQAKLESIWNEDSLIINDAPVEEADETEVAEAVKGPGVDAINDLLDMGVSKEDLFDQMMRDHSDDELMSFAQDYRRDYDMASDIDPDDDNSNIFQQSNY
jgi:hypothetical protein|tara:strand:+ start:228 stop:551 length:324 start_codon:yes stop_codon:yes gene_type:complete